MFCPDCGMGNANHQKKFCRRCGVNLIALERAREVISEIITGAPEQAALVTGVFVARP